MLSGRYEISRDILVGIFAFYFLIFVSYLLVRLYAFCFIIFLQDLLKRWHAFLPLWDLLMKFVAFAAHFLWRCHYEISCFVRFCAFCCTAFVRDTLLRFHAFLGHYELCVWDLMLFLALMRFSWLDLMLFGCRICKDGGEVDIEGCGRLSVHDGLLNVAWFCVCKLGGS
jgi:hypothetical protein